MPQFTLLRINYFQAAWFQLHNGQCQPGQSMSNHPLPDIKTLLEPSAVTHSWPTLVNDKCQPEVQKPTENLEVPAGKTAFSSAVPANH